MTVKFSSPAELRARRPEGIPWVWEGYLARGAVTLLAGRPKVGKSTLACALAEAVASDAETFLTRPVVAAPVVYVIEEGADTAIEKLGDDRIRVLVREDAWPKPPWRDLIAEAVEEAARVSAALIVVDTFAAWAALGPDQENNAGAIQAALDPLVAAAQRDLAVLLVHHARKNGGDGGVAVRGSSALTGGVDAILELDRGEATTRVLEAVGRWAQTPARLVVDRDTATGGWGVTGPLALPEETLEDDQRRALEVLDQHQEIGLRDIRAALEGIGAPRIAHALKELQAQGLVSHSPGGPYRRVGHTPDTPDTDGSQACPVPPPLKGGTRDTPTQTPDTTSFDLNDEDLDLLARAERLAADHADLAGAES
jgi:hypothetical protein